MNTVFLRDFTEVIKKHPESWNKPCLLPRDIDCGKYIDDTSICRLDFSLKVIEWKENDVLHWTHFDEIYITKPTKILGKLYIKNIEKLDKGV